MAKEPTWPVELGRLVLTHAEGAEHLARPAGGDATHQGTWAFTAEQLPKSFLLVASNGHVASAVCAVATAVWGIDALVVTRATSILEQAFKR